jgi:3D (Asp-Asp-Asp) domain-containing protein
MRSPARLVLLASCLIVGACATQRPLPTYEKPLARASVQYVRTTAYTDTESDHRPYGCHNALGTSLCYGPVNSAAADWSRWPAGTVFRIRETGELYRVDDYGWALSGTNTIDLYKPSRASMNAWGVHHVNLEIVRWGDVWSSYDVLKPRDKYAHVRRMLKEIDGRYARNSHQAEPTVASVAAPLPALSAQSSTSSQPAASVPMATVPADVRWPKAQPVTTQAVAASPTQPSVAVNPFYR